MKIWTSEHTFSHPWETIAQAALRKYPNPMNTAVLGTDIIDRKIIDGVLHTHRLVVSDFKFPSWTHPLIGSAKVCYASEHSEVDPSNKAMVLKTKNLTFCNYVSVDETLKYEPHPTDKTKTVLKQEAIIMCRGIPLASYMEDLLTKTISFNAGAGRQAIEWVINLNKEVKELANSAVKSIDESLVIHNQRTI